MGIETLVPAPPRPFPKLDSYKVLDMAFGEGAGARLGDKSRYRSHGTIVTATWAAGLHGFCLNFVAANPDYVTIPAAHNQLDFTTEDFSVVMRTFIPVLAASHVFFMRGLDNVDGYRIHTNAAGVLHLRTNQALANQNSTTAAGAIVAGVWQTLGVSRHGVLGDIYVNGVFATAVPGGHIDPLTANRNCLIGINEGLAWAPMNGRIEFTRVFRGIALTASEHLAWHRALM